MVDIATELMRLYHEGSRPAMRGGLTSSDEEDCYSQAGHRRGIWLTSEPLTGPWTRSMDLPLELVAAFELTAPGDAHRTFVVPATSIDSYPSRAGTEIAVAD